MKKQTIIKKQCIVCAAEFEAKRSDANYCSEKCRAKANYQIRRKKASGEFSPLNSPENSPLINPFERAKNIKIELNGALNIGDIRQLIADSEHSFLNLCEENTTIKAQIEELSKKKSQICTQIIDLLEVKVKKLETMQQLSDTDLYNNFLNGEYQEAVKDNNSFADFKLITPQKLSLESSGKLLFRINQYRLKIKNLILTHISEVSRLDQQIKDIDIAIKRQNKTIEENQASIRFYQTRIIRLEQLLSG